MIMARRFKYKPFTSVLTGLTFALLYSGHAHAQAQPSEFDMGWGNMNWPTNSIGPNTFTQTSEHGFELQIRIGIAQILSLIHI